MVRPAGDLRTAELTLFASPLVGGIMFKVIAQAF
jgi:hypothetical protein